MKLHPVTRSWLPLAAGLTVVFGTVYGVGQQMYRQSAFDPQVQQARDAGLDTIDGRVVNMKRSLAVFQMNFADAKTGEGEPRVLATTGQLDGKTVTPPGGVFNYVKHHGEDQFTWQPAKGVRLAAVVVRKDGGYVLVARNLSEIERRSNHLLGIIGLGWILSLAVSLGTSWRLVKH